MSIEYSVSEKEKNPDQQIQEYISKRHAFLKDSYKSPDGSNEACFLVALDVAEVLIEQGKQVELVSVSAKKLVSKSFSERVWLNPVGYINKTEWGGHVISVSDDLVYDPIHDKPIRVRDYGMVVFGTELDMKTILTHEKVREAILRVKQTMND